MNDLYVKLSKFYKGRLDFLAAALEIKPCTLWRYRSKKRSPCARVRKKLDELCKKHGVKCGLSDI